MLFKGLNKLGIDIFTIL